MHAPHTKRTVLLVIYMAKHENSSQHFLPTFWGAQIRELFGLFWEPLRKNNCHAETGRYQDKKCTLLTQNLHVGTRLSEMGAMLGSNLVLGESIAL